MKTDMQNTEIHSSVAHRALHGDCQGVHGQENGRTECGVSVHQNATQPHERMAS